MSDYKDYFLQDDGTPLPPSKLSQAKFRDLCRMHTREALNTIVQLMKSDDQRVALQASVHILDRGFGKPVQTTELTGKNGDSLFADLTDAQIKEEVRKRLTDPRVLESLGIEADVIGIKADTRVN